MYSLKEVARLAGVHWITLYRWEKLGVIPHPKRLVRNDRRVYSDEDLQAIRKYKDATK